MVEAAKKTASSNKVSEADSKMALTTSPYPVTNWERDEMMRRPLVPPAEEERITLKLGADHPLTGEEIQKELDKETKKNSKD